MSGTIGLGALESLLDDIQNEEESKFNDTLENMLNSMSVEKEGQVFSALPTQSVHSLELHSAVVEHYQKKNHLCPRTKEDFMRRKAKAKLSRQKKKGLEYAEKREIKQLKVKSKNKSKHRMKR